MRIGDRWYSVCWLGAILLNMGLLRWMDLPSHQPRSTTDRVKQQFIWDVNRLDQLIQARLLEPAQQGAHLDTLRRGMRVCRQAYKTIEAFTEYFFPVVARLVNGPAQPEIEVYEPNVLAPGGFQVVEEILFSDVDSLRRDDLVVEIRKIRRELKRCRNLWQAISITDSHVFDALRLQIFRVMALGITGFDTPISREAIPEAAASVSGLRKYISLYQSASSPESDRLSQLFRRAESYLETHSDFNSFDRARFITQFATPLSAALLAFQGKKRIALFKEERALRTQVVSLFEANAFNADFFSAATKLKTTRAKVELGKKLFFDPILSIGNARSCASCHQPQKAFTDGLPKQVTLTGTALIRRNTPTILNAALQPRLFYDMRAKTLESQSTEVIHNPDEMHGSLLQAAQKLAHSSTYMGLFRNAFPEATEHSKPEQIENALAAYERSLLSLNARFDRYMRGDPDQLSVQEIRGLNLFLGKARCGSCHFIPLFNGTRPPAFTQSESEVLGVPVGPRQKQIDPDLGRYVRTRLPLLKYSFKTPTLRNIALTAPYMHNGSFRTLEEVMAFYNEGGGRGLGIELPNQTLPSEKLNLSAEEQAAVIAFMKTLTDVPNE